MLNITAQQLDPTLPPFEQNVSSDKGNISIGEALAAFIDNDQGLFVEVGAGDGVNGSITEVLEQRGWTGLLIEAEAEISAQCRQNRPICGVVNFECNSFDALEENQENHEGYYRGERHGQKGSRRSLSSILQEYGIDKIDLLAVNATKAAADILSGLDLSQHRPGIVAVKGTMDAEVNTRLLEWGYHRANESTKDFMGTSYEVYRVGGRLVAVDRVTECPPTDRIKVLEKAWDIAAKSNASYPGKYMAYYSLNVDGAQFSGERPWEDRWSYIGPALREACGGELAGKRILELGCNLGLLSVWAAREGAECRGYEYQSDILEGGKLLATAFGVSEQCRWQQADFNKAEVTDAITDEADVCTCLSVMNWVNNKDNLIRFLSKQKVVLYEGHDSDAVEIGRLNQAGFLNVAKVTMSERGRGVFLARKDAVAKAIDWEEFERRYNLVGAPYHVPKVCKGDGTTHERVYLKTEVWKVRLSDDKNPAKFASPQEEAHYLKKLRGVENVCRLKEFREKEDHTITILEHFPNLGTLEEVSIPRDFQRSVEAEKHRIIKAVNDAGVLHNDMHDRNFLVGPDYHLCLIDFDQAQAAEGRNDYDHGYYRKVPKSTISTAAEYNKEDLLEKAWDIAAKSNASYPGKYMAYYSLNVDGAQFSGERPWEDRWSYIGPALREACGGELAGKRILELGCNLGLLSVWAAREGAECRGYEYQSDILEGGKLLATAFGVSEQCRWQQADFNKAEVTDAITDEADVCTCLSVMNWVNNKDNLIRFLSKQKVVLYEGHDSDAVEIGRLNQAGFLNVAKVTMSERGRGVFLAKR